jgi:hypothetical protein
VTVPQIYTVIVLAVLGALVCAWQIRVAVLDTRADDQATAARTRVGLPPAAADNVPGTHLADLDECELIWATPGPDDDADWLRDAVRDAFRDALEKRGEDPA